MTLKELRVGDVAVIVDIAAEPDTKRRLLDIGLSRGAEIRVKRFAPLGDPVEIAVKDFSLALRKADASKITVRRREGAGDTAPERAGRRKGFGIRGREARAARDAERETRRAAWRGESADPDGTDRKMETELRVNVHTGCREELFKARKSGRAEAAKASEVASAAPEKDRNARGGDDLRGGRFGRRG